jgi:Spy/CpxP family protein refolding chaperone
MKKIVITSLAALLLIGAISYGVWAADRGPGNGPMAPGNYNTQDGPRNGYNALNLTYEQDLKLLDIRQQFERETLDSRFAMQRKNLELRQLWSVKPLNQAAIEAKTKEVTGLRVEMTNKGQALRDKMRSVLIPEQQKLFDSQSNKTGFRGPGMGQGRRGGNGDCH